MDYNRRKIVITTRQSLLLLPFGLYNDTYITIVNPIDFITFKVRYSFIRTHKDLEKWTILDV